MRHVRQKSVLLKQGVGASAGINHHEINIRQMFNGVKIVGLIMETVRMSSVCRIFPKLHRRSLRVDIDYGDAIPRLYRTNCQIAAYGGLFFGAF